MASFFGASLIIATLMVGIWFGMMYFVAVVMMPGFADLSNKDFLRGFIAIDSMFQRFTPFIFVVWFGSAIFLIVATVMGALEYKGGNESVHVDLLYAAVGLYVPGHVTTLVFNVPLNNHVQTLDLDNMSDQEIFNERTKFEGPWNFWNMFRVVTEGIASVCLLMTMFYYEPSEG